ncbi:hypothetical protein T440DRAFT_225011 [Plenodomus tracheiphilus IPT5]|uniref:Uncharacterized protein n=1 Tax=Plenodomus tracheiphilus IPT5 TaxID=1408161 RepID=A0A6A7ATQ6_9PLEO|nr:hypothetical protein T440DRAFT_225011 [Plenodomus tracheiphilus IPT5]
MSTQTTTQTTPKPKRATSSTKKMATQNPDDQQRIPDHEIKQNSGVSATMALQAAQKAWELRQAANAAGDPNAREEILAKAINKEIEAESFGKAAKYTQSGAFQGLAAGAGLGVQPGVKLGQLTGALVGGVVATVTGLVGGGIGSVYGAMNGPFWNLGEMASQGVRGVVGDFPNWKSTPAQKRALEKMVMQTKETQAPSKEELEEMSKYAPDDMPQTWSQSAKDMTAWRPSMPSMPNMPSMPTGAALGLGGLGASMPSWGSKDQASNDQAPTPNRNQQKPQPQEKAPVPKEAPKPKEAPTPKEAPSVEKTSTPASPPKKRSRRQAEPKAQPPSPKSASSSTEKPPKATATSTSQSSKPKPKPAASKPPSNSQTPKEPPTLSQTKTPPAGNSKEQNVSAAPTEAAKRKPRKLDKKTIDSAQPAPAADATLAKKAPRKLAARNPAA